MFRRSLAMLIIIAICITGASAATQMQFALGLTSSGFGIKMSKPQDGKFSTSFDEAVLDADLVLDFEKGHGMVVGLKPDFSKSIVGFRTGYAYVDSLGAKADMLITAGLGLTLGSTTTIGAFAGIAFNLKVMSNMFFRVGTGVDMEFVTFSSSGTKADITILMPLPSVSIGWNF